VICGFAPGHKSEHKQKEKAPTPLTRMGASSGLCGQCDRSRMSVRL
jgi:hypothetical protein